MITEISWSCRFLSIFQGTLQVFSHLSNESNNKIIYSYIYIYISCTFGSRFCPIPGKVELVIFNVESHNSYQEFASQHVKTLTSHLILPISNPKKEYKLRLNKHQRWKKIGKKQLDSTSRSILVVSDKTTSPGKSSLFY